MPRYPRRVPLSRHEQELAASCYALALRKAAYFGRDFPALREEAVSAACVALVLAARAYRPEMGFKFTTYAGRAIRSHLQKLASGPYVRRRRDAGFVERTFTDTECAAPHGSSKVTDTDVISDRSIREGSEYAEDRELLALAWKHATEFERRLFHYAYVDQMTAAEIGREIGYSREHTRQLLKKALERLRSILDPVPSRTTPDVPIEIDWRRL